MALFGGLCPCPLASLAPRLETPQCIHSQGPHCPGVSLSQTTPLRITLALTCPRGPTLSAPSASCKQYRLEVWPTGSPASPPLLSPEKQAALLEQPWQLRGCAGRAGTGQLDPPVSRLPSLLLRFLECSQPCCSQRCPGLTHREASLSSSCH